MTNNYVDIIGYQLEKIHTGIVSYLLDTKNTNIPMHDKVTILNRFLGNNTLKQSNILNINTTREYSFGRRGRIDLVIEVIQTKGQNFFLIMEFKTDSDVNIDQLKGMKNSFQEKTPNSECSYFIVTLGAGQFTYQHMKNEIEELEFHIVDISAFLRIFSNLSISKNNSTFDSWYDSLKAEKLRHSIIEKELLSVNNPRESDLRNKGYRVGFPVYYTYYAKLRELINQSSFKNWAIYSGSNNPVLNWQNGWLQKTSRRGNFSLYWEFNWESFRLKAQLNPKQIKDWRSLKTEIESICLRSNVSGKRTRLSRGTWVSIYKWNFDFSNQSVRKISNQTIKILADLHYKLDEASF